MNNLKSFMSLFHALPEAVMVLLPDAPEFTIVEVNKAHQEYSGKKRDELIKKPLATVFPDNPDAEESAGLELLRKSFQKVVDTGKEYKLSEFRYDVEDPKTGEFVERYWTCINKPVFDDNGTLIYILQTVKEVTDEIQTRTLLKSKLKDEKIIFRQAESLSNIGSWELDLEKEEVYWSEGVYKIIGYKPDEYKLTYNSAMKIIHPDDREHAIEQMKNAIEGKGQYEVEKRFLHKDGSVRQIISRGSIKKDENGKPVRLIGIFQDVTEEVNLYSEYEQAIYELRERAKEQRCLYAISSLDEGNLTVDELLNKSILVLPEGFQFPDIAGVRIEFGEGEFVSDIFEDSKWKIEASSTRIPDKKLTVTAAYSEKVWPEHKKPFILEEIGLLESVAHQLSLKVAKILQQQELIESKNRIQKILNQSLDAICTIDEQGNFVDVSEASRTVWGYKPEEIEGTPFMGLVHPDDHNLTDRVKAEIMGGQEFTNFENRYIKKDGSVVNIIWSARWDEEDKLMYCVAKDASEIKRAEKDAENEGKRYKSVFMQLPAYFCMLQGKDHRYEMVNPEYLKLIGKSDIIGKPVTEVLPEIEGQPFVELLDQAFKTGEIVEENEMPLKLDRGGDGNLETIYLKFSYIPNKKNSDGKVEGLFIFAVDITEQVRARKHIQVSNERYEYVTQATSDAIWDFEPATGKLYWGQGFKTLFGHENIGVNTGFKKWVSNIHPDDLGKIESGIKELLEGDENRWDEEYRFKKADGTYAFVRDKAIVIRDEDGNTVRVVGAMEDITLRKQEEQQLKLMESVVTNITDAVLITNAEPFDSPEGPEIVYVNEAFEKMTGYSADEVIGKTPRILQGPNSDDEALKEFGKKIRRWEPAAVETINYKKNGEEFWINFSVTPIANEKGWYTHWISVERDVTERKNRELKQELISDIGRIFNSTESLRESLKKVLGEIQKLGDFELAEIWLVNHNSNSIVLAASLEDQIEQFYQFANGTESFRKGEGLPGVTWMKGERQFWKNLDNHKDFARSKAAKKAGMKTAYGLPVLVNNDVIGALLLGVKDEPKHSHYFTPILKEIAEYLGDEIQRKRLEEELSRIFTSAPDGIIIAGFDGYLKKVNPAMSEILGYSEKELMNRPFIDFIHPDDRERTKKFYEEANSGTEKSYFENRYITKSGQVVWLSWTFKVFLEEEVTYTVAKNITDQKELEDLLERANRLAKIGSWEVDFIKETNFWSDITREIHEVEPDYEPVLNEGINFYKEGEDREKILEAVDRTIKIGDPFDEELRIITAKGNERWIRAIGEAEFVDGQCVRIYGSFQDIHQRKEAELSFVQASEERDRILESISDAFYALDSDWNFTYFNREAERLLGKKSEDVIGQSILKAYPGIKEGVLFEVYSEVMNERQPRNFEFFDNSIQRWFDLTAYPAENGIAVYFKDSTERKEAQARILEKTSQLDAIAIFNGQLIKKDRWIQALDDCLGIFGNVVDADRVYYFEVDYSERKQENVISMRLEWAREGIKPELDNPAHYELPFSKVQFFIDPLIKNKTFNYTIDEILDDEFKELLLHQDIKSLLAVPVFVDGEFRGIIGFDDCTRKRMWNEDEISTLETISYNLASAIENEDAEKALQVAFKEKNEILESIGDAFFAVDTDWTVTYWNHMAENVLGMPREKIVGENLWDLYEDATSLKFYTEYHKAVNEQVTVHFEEYYPGTESWFEVSAYPSQHGLSVFFKDVTDRKESERQLKELNQSLEQQAKELATSNAELEQFAFVASHDLQEPLRMITGFLAQLEKKYDHLLDEKGKKYIHFATDGAKRMRQIILDLLEFSRVGRIDIEREKIDLNDLIKEIHSLNKKLITERKAEIHADDLPIIFAARGPMRQLFQNLINNAIKYQEEGNKPDIHIEWNEDEKYWYFSVRDNGIGFNEEYKNKIFNIFQRLHGKDEYSGSGMGLAICKKIVEDHGGEILAESKKGEGSIFKFAIAKESV